MKYPLLLVCGVLCVGLGAGCGSSAVDSVGTDVPTVTGATATSTMPATTTTAVTSTAPIVKQDGVTSTKPVISRPPVRSSPPTDSKVKPSISYVAINEDAFSPKVLVVRAGDSVIWVNRSHMNHTVTASEVALLWDSGNLAPGKSFKHTFPYPGTYNYYCGIHAGMKATVVVR